MGSLEIRKKKRWKKSYYYVSGVFIFILTIALHLTEKLQKCINLQQHHNILPQPSNNQEQRKITNEECDLFSGKWVFDNQESSYPLYEESRCSFMKPDYACQRYGRRNLTYQYWKWKPHSCDLPRFNGIKLLEKIRGKRVVFVGDSLNRNQWTSLLCLIESSLHQSSNKSVARHDNLFVFNATEYNATIEFYWSPLLVESNSDDPYKHSIREEIVLKINSIEKHAKHWTDSDILIFDCFMWWIKDNITLLWGSLGSHDAVRKEVAKTPRFYEMSLNTWSDWLEIHIDRNKTKLFFMSLSPFHYNGEALDGRQCYGETEPALKEDYWGAETDREMMRAAESVIERLEKRGVHVQYMNITHLSDYRKDAHTSIYKKFKKPKTSEQLANPKALADCVHWCLPGVPDVWNIILYHYIINIKF